MKKLFANKNPQCSKCMHRAHLAGFSETSWFCAYIIDTGIVPGYRDEKGIYHRDTYPKCKEFEFGSIDRIRSI